MTVRIIIADVLEALRSLPDESVNTCVTSPPYWGLRDYGVPGQLGLERTLGEHLEAMVSVFAEVRRVLRKDGTCWINYGDCYAAAPNGRSAAATKAAGNDDRSFRDKPFSTVGAIYDPAGGASGGGYRGGAKNTHNPRGRVVAGCDAGEGPLYSPSHATERGAFSSGDRQSRHDHGGRVVAGGYLKPKDLVMMSNRLAIALQDAGWWVRSEIIWHKPNPMPESIKDRPGTSHEKIWLLSKSARYFYDAEAVREAEAVPDWDNGTRVFGGKNKHGANVQHGDRTTGRLATPRKRGLPPRHAQYASSDQSGLDSVGRGNGRNQRNVWTIATRPFPEAHFATFPPEIPKRCIKAGCPIGGTVLDPFAGAGTTGLVAEQLGRNSVLIELSPTYAEMARRRIEAHLMHAVVTVEGLDCASAEAAE
ncbi:site-specific DNA-methyltransferase [Thalassobaculum sp.]|uniref:DNA-methyltransferase n=1 Tax=Thalassobaculum sp. TaxID=2022740 RepID=UPI0032ECAC9C